MKRPPKKNDGRGFFSRRRPRDDDRPERRDERPPRREDRRDFDDREDAPRRSYADEREDDRRPSASRREESNRHLPVRQNTAEVIDQVRQSEEKTAAMLAQPLGELAKAFALQAEMLKSVHETQQRLTKAMEDDSKNEVMLNSTNALNETFRGVRSVQQGLIDKLDRSDKSSRVWRAVATVAIVLALGGGVWGVQKFLRYLNDRDRAIDEKVGNVEKSVAERANALLDEALAEKARAREEVIKNAGDLETLRKEALKLASEKAAFETDAAHLKVENEDLKKDLAERQKSADELKRRVEKLDYESRDTLVKLEEARKEIDRLHTEVIDRMKAGERLNPIDVEQAGRQKPIVGDDKNAAAKKTEPAVAAAPAPVTPGGDETVIVGPPPKPAAETGDDGVVKPLGGEVVEKPTAETAKKKPEAEIGAGDLRESSKAEARVQAQTLVNKLLEKHRSNHVFRIESVGAIAKDGALEDVVLSESVPGRGVVKNVSAKRLVINVSPQGDIVDLNFDDGGVATLGSNGRLGDSAPFYNQKYRISVLCLNGDDWLRARQPYITTK